MASELLEQNAVGLFITMNPGYEGRTNLGETQKAEGRFMDFTLPDRKLLMTVWAARQGLGQADKLGPML